MERPVYSEIFRRLAADGKMIFLSGPRQSGKTTFAKGLLNQGRDGEYFNWDSHLDRSRFAKDPLFFRNMNRGQPGSPLVVLDEIHKYSNWKPYLKGVYDDFSHDFQFLITGSGRLDSRKRSGEALTGRFVSMPFFPLTLGELAAAPGNLAGRLKEPFELTASPTAGETQNWWQGLARHSGFPEPFLKGEDDFWRRWSDTFANQIVREDMKDLHDLRRMDRLSLLLSLLPSRVGSPLSQNQLGQSLGVAFESVKAWLGLFEAFFLTFHLETYTRRVARSILKEKKVYLYNLPEVTDPGARFENQVALELYRSICRANALGEGRFGLYYLKNKDQREVDFLVTENALPSLLVETKRSDEEVSPALLEFQAQMNVPAVQLVENRDGFRRIRYGKNEVMVVAAHCWLAGLP